MKRNLLKLTLAMALVAVTTCLAFGQAPTAPLNGAVTDPNGAAVAGAGVLVKDDAIGAEFQATTSGNGTFSIPALAVGTYTVTVTAQGFKQAIIKEVKIDAGTAAVGRI